MRLTLRTLASYSSQPSPLLHIVEVMQHDACIGGAVAVDYSEPRRAWVKWYLRGWAFWARFFNMKQGAAVFCRRDAFRLAGGYDESIYVGEDVEFYWRLSKYARRTGRVVHFVRTPKVRTSSRRFDGMTVWRTLVRTHPIVIWFKWKQKSFWKDWYEMPPR